jgi:hypothetical protein
LRKGDHLKDAGVDRRIILKWIFDEWDRSMELIDLVQDRGRWRAVVIECGNKRSGFIKCGEYCD